MDLFYWLHFNAEIYYFCVANLFDAMPQIAKQGNFFHRAANEEFFYGMAVMAKLKSPYFTGTKFSNQRVLVEQG